MDAVFNFVRDDEDLVWNDCSDHVQRHITINILSWYACSELKHVFSTELLPRANGCLVSGGQWDHPPISAPAGRTWACVLFPITPWSNISPYIFYFLQDKSSLLQTSRFSWSKIRQTLLYARWLYFFTQLLFTLFYLQYESFFLFLKMRISPNIHVF